MKSERCLDLTLFPTEACNFRCNYCCQALSYGRMEPAIVRGVKAFLSRRGARLDELNLAWFGGEPLLALDIIESVMGYVQTMAGKRSRLRISSGITTNGFNLSRSVAKRLLDCSVTDYQVTLDGPRQWHDERRVLANGSGTFDRIWDNLVAMTELPDRFRVIVSLNVDQDNCRHIPKLIEELAGVFGHDPRIKLWVRPVSRLGGPNDAVLPVLEGRERQGAVDSLRRVAKRHQVYLLSTEEVRPICYAARERSLVIRSNGRVNKCTVALEEPVNQVGRLYEDGHLEIDESRFMRWTRGQRTGDAQQLKCPMRGISAPVHSPEKAAAQDRTCRSGRALIDAT